MRFEQTKLKGAFIVDVEPMSDDRGFFARSFCARQFENLGLQYVVAQCNISFNIRKGTARGMHYSVEPGAEAKLVRCTQGAVWDVIADLRPDSSTYLQYFSVELNAKNRRAIFIPAGFAHGFQTLADNSEVFYQMNKLYMPEVQRGYRYDDPAFMIDWPLKVTAISDRDANAPFLRDTSQ